MAVLHVNRSTQSPHIFGNIVAEDDRAHRGFARAALAHQQYLFLLLSVIHDCQIAKMRGYDNRDFV